MPRQWLVDSLGAVVQYVAEYQPPILRLSRAASAAPQWSVLNLQLKCNQPCSYSLKERGASPGRNGPTPQAQPATRPQLIQSFAISDFQILENERRYFLIAHAGLCAVFVKVNNYV